MAKGTAVQKVPIWKLVDEMIGMPDFAVCFSVWPWPDGGWMAGVALMDAGSALAQDLPMSICALKEEHDPSWNVFDGFKNGINVHAGTSNPEDAILKLYQEVEKRNSRSVIKSSKPFGDS